MTIRDKGELAGFMLSGPEFGVLWQYWNYIDPRHRSGTLAMRVMRTALPLWDNDRFHKIMTYSRPENKVSIALMERYRYKLVADTQAAHVRRGLPSLRVQAHQGQARLRSRHRRRRSSTSCATRLRRLLPF